MLTFEQFLIESSRSFPLYHGIRHDDKTFEILKRGELQPKTFHRGWDLLLQPFRSYSGISTTRNIDFAKKWISRQSSLMVVLELNHKAIEYNHKIIPINYFNGPRSKEYYGGDATNLGYSDEDEEKVKLKKVENEYEEFIVTNKPIPLNDRYLTAIHVSRGRFNSFKKGTIPRDMTWVTKIVELLETKYKDKVKFY